MLWRLQNGFIKQFALNLANLHLLDTYKHRNGFQKFGYNMYKVFFENLQSGPNKLKTLLNIQIR